MNAAPTLSTPQSPSEEMVKAALCDDKRGHKGKTRLCLATSLAKDKSELIRFALSPDKIVTPDINNKLPGRGVWVSAQRLALETVLAKNSFARGFKGKAIIPDDFVKMVEFLLCRRVLGLLTMSRKSGYIFIGFDQVKAAAQAGSLAWRIEARDGSMDGRSKIRTLSKAVAKELELPLPKVLGCFSEDELAKALSRDSVIHIGLPRGPFAKTFGADVTRLAGFRDLVPEDWPDIAHEQQYQR